MAVPQKILDLIDLFERNADAYRAATFNEANTRLQFINPFFAALDWDMDNKKGHAEMYKEVVHEDSIQVAGSKKAPDYCFRIGGTRKFFVEAKKPAARIRALPRGQSGTRATS